MDKRKEQALPEKREIYLECEKVWVFWTLMFVGGYFGAYTYTIRGGVFSNAQTANLLMLAVQLGRGNPSGALYYLIPFSAYFGGTVLSELLATEIKRFRALRWDTLLVGIECLAVFALGLLPAEYPDQICQVTLNFLCAMQFNTFRQAEGVGMATTFCTNHVREFGSNLVKYLRSGNRSARRKYRLHAAMLLLFLLGVASGTLAGRLFGYRSIWGAGIVLLLLFLRLLLADRTYERDLLNRIPRGH